MSDEPEDVEDITSICGGLNINIGTLNQNSIKAMFLAGKKAQELGHVLLLDPVGAGASALRTNTAVNLMKELSFDVIRGNISEIKTLALRYHLAIFGIEHTLRQLERVFTDIAVVAFHIHGKRGEYPFVIAYVETGHMLKVHTPY